MDDWSGLQLPSIFRPMAKWVNEQIEAAFQRRNIGTRFIPSSSIRGGVTPTAHAASHQDGGSDEIDVTGLSGLLADPQTPDTHASEHESGGGDEITLTNLSSGAAGDGQVPTADGVGGIAWEDQAGSSLTVKEEDASPSVANVTEIRVSNGKLTDNGGGSVSLNLSGDAGSPDASTVTYTPTTATDWDGDADPGNVDDALDQLAERVDDLEGAGGGSGDVTYAQLLAMQICNEIAAWPPLVADNTDLDAVGQWWRKIGTPTTAPTVVAVSGEGITETYHRAIKCVTDAADEGLKNLAWTYANEPRVKSGRKLSALAAIWCVGGVGVTMKLVNSDASETAAAEVTAAAWTVVEVPNHTLAGTSCELQFVADGAGTFYVVPLGANIGARGLPLGPRPTRMVDGTVTVVSNANPADTNWIDVDITASTSPLTYAVDLMGMCQASSGGYYMHVRANGSSEAQSQSNHIATSNGTSYGRVYIRRVLLDDGQVYEYSAQHANVQAVTHHIINYWEWA